jgi:hypothetical protein
MTAPAVRHWHGVALPADAAGGLVIPDGPAGPRPARKAQPRWLAGRDLLAWKMTEIPELHGWVAALLAVPPPRGYRGLIWSYHPGQPERDRAGFPDWLLMSPHGVMVREEKREGYPPTPEQAWFLAQAAEHGINAGMWYPHHRLDGTIIRELHQLAYGKDTPVADKFALDEAKARKVIASQETGPEWDPRADDGSDVASLFIAACDAGAITTPGGVHLHFENDRDDDGPGYRWFVTTGLLTLSSVHEEIRHIGEPGSTGEEQALAILREAVDTGGYLLGALAAYVTARGGRP